MTRTRKFKWFGWATIALAVVLAGLLVGCAEPQKGVGDGFGELRINLSDSMMSKQIMPESPLEADIYRVHGAGQDGYANCQSFDADVLATNPVLNIRLLPGNWQITVEVKNVQALTVGLGGPSYVLVNIETPVTLFVHCYPYSDGPGHFSVAATWISGMVQAPAGIAQLIPSTGVPINIPATVPPWNGGGTWSLQYAAFPGWYVGRFSLYDGTTIVAGAADIVRIAYYQWTRWALNFTIEQLQGEATFGFDYTLVAPLTLEVSPAVGPIVLDKSDHETVLLEVLGADFDASKTGIFWWYKNGELMSDQTSNILVSADPMILPRTYNYSAICWQSDGTRVGSANWLCSAKP
jgi:hypothetical protein